MCEWQEEEGRRDYKESGVFFQAEDGIRDIVRSRGLGDVYKRKGYAYEYGDNVPITWRDPRPEFNGPQESGVDPRNPARYSAPIQCFIGMQMSW